MSREVFNEFYKLVDDGLLTYRSLTPEYMESYDVELLANRVFERLDGSVEVKSIKEFIISTFGKEDETLLW